MGDSRPVNLVLSLPSELADEVERVQEDDPGYFERVITYGIVRRAVFENLRGSIAPCRSPTPSYEAGYK